MPRRVGMTLVEVLVAIFVMAIGMLSLLTLFPLGALRMANAIQNDKCAQAAVNASALADVKNVRSDMALTDPTGQGRWNAFNDGKTHQGSNDPNDTASISAALNSALPSPDGPSYAVFVDPLGFLASVSPTWLAADPQSKIQRCRPSYTFGLTASPYTAFAGALINAKAYQSFAMMDDIIYDKNTGFGLTPFQRELNYTWAYLLQRPRTSDPSVVTCSVVVYNKRPMSLTSNLNLPEFVYPAASFNTSKNSITITFTAASEPPLRPGDWILDSTVIGSAPAVPHATFYRVVGLNPISATSIEYEVDRSLRGFPAGAVSTGTAVVLEGVVEVFERGVGRH